MVREFSIRYREKLPRQEPALLIVLGEDIQNFQTSYHITGGSDPDTPQLEDAGVTVTRYEAPLAEALRWVLESAQLAWEQPQLLSPDDLFALLLEQLDYGTEPDEVNRTGGMLEDQLSNLGWTARVFWLQADVTIPAGESRRLSASSRKEPSRNFGGSGAQELVGFDLAPWLDSNLAFTGQTAVLETREQVGIVRQNFGFDLKNDIKTARLEKNQEHYYLEVTRTANVPTGAPAAASEK